MECEFCGKSDNLFKMIVLSPCKEHTHEQIVCNEDAAEILIENPEFVELIEKI